MEVHLRSPYVIIAQHLITGTHLFLGVNVHKYCKLTLVSGCYNKWIYIYIYIYIWYFVVETLSSRCWKWGRGNQKMEERGIKHESQWQIHRLFIISVGKVVEWYQFWDLQMDMECVGCDGVKCIRCAGTGPRDRVIAWQSRYRLDEVAKVCWLWLTISTFLVILCHYSQDSTWRIDTAV